MGRTSQETMTGKTYEQRVKLAQTQGFKSIEQRFKELHESIASDMAVFFGRRSRRR